MPAEEARAAELRSRLVTCGRAAAIPGYFAGVEAAWYRFETVIRGRILVIDGDEWLGPLLVRVLQEKGFMADFRDEARSRIPEGVRLASRLPSCAASCSRTSTASGSRGASAPRSGRSSKTPLVLVGEAADKDARIQGLQVGADVLLERPVTNEEIVAQVEALVAMARRFRPDMPEEQSAPSLAAAFRGDLSNFPLASVLMMLEMERRTGSLEVVSGSNKRALLVLSTGLFANTELGGEPRPAIDVLREVLSWRTGRFAFRPRDAGSLPPPRGSVGALVLEAMRLEDERKNAAAG